MSALLTLRFTRVSPTRHRFEYRRADGTGEAIEMETRSLLTHDLLHYAVESEAHLKGSFYGILGKIGGYEELSGRRRRGAGRRDRHHRAGRRGADGRAAAGGPRRGRLQAQARRVPRSLRRARAALVHAGLRRRGARADAPAHRPLESDAVRRDAWNWSSLPRSGEGRSARSGGRVGESERHRRRVWRRTSPPDRSAVFPPHEGEGDRGLATTRPATGSSASASGSTAAGLAGVGAGASNSKASLPSFSTTLTWPPLDQACRTGSRRPAAS